MPSNSTPPIHYGRPEGLDLAGEVVAASGLKCIEYGGAGHRRLTEFIFTDFSMIIDRTAGDNFVGTKIYDFPRGIVQPLGGAFYGTLTTISVPADTLNKAKVVQIGFGTATAATAVANVLDAACYNVLPGNPLAIAAGVPTLPSFTTANQDAAGGASAAIAAWLSQQTAIVALTDSSGGTASDTLAAITGSYVEATIENTVASLAAKINSLIASANARGGAVKAIDGSSTAADLYVNLNVATDGDIDADATVTLNGRFLFEWSLSGGWAYYA